MINVVFYDSDTGIILSYGQMTQAQAEVNAKEHDCAYLVVDIYPYRYDATHRVEDGTLVEIA